MIKFENGTIAPGYVEFTETTLSDLDRLVTEYAGEALEPLRLSRFSAELVSIGFNCGQILMANAGSEISYEICDQLTSNMNPDLLDGFSFGFGNGVYNELLVKEVEGVTT